MDCINFVRIADNFLTEGLTDEDLSEFLLHMDGCEACREELEVRFVVIEGTKLLERDHADYDLRAAFESFLKKAERNLGFRKLMIRLSYIADTCIFWAVLAAMFVYLRVSFF